MELSALLPGWNYTVSLIDDEDGWVVSLRALLAESTDDVFRPIRVADKAVWTTEPQADPEKAFLAALEVAATLDQAHLHPMRKAIRAKRELWRKPPQAIAA